MEVGFIFTYAIIVIHCLGCQFDFRTCARCILYYETILITVVLENWKREINKYLITRKFQNYIETLTGKGEIDTLSTHTHG